MKATPIEEDPYLTAKLVADIITPEVAQQNPHLKNLSGNVIIANEFYQFVFSGVSPGPQKLGWTPLILAVFIKTKTTWSLSECLSGIDVRRNWTDRPLPTKITAVVPSLAEGLAKLDVVYEINPGGAELKKEFFSVYLRENDPRLYFVTDHMQFEKQRKQLEARMAFRARIKADDFFQTNVQSENRVEAFSFDCKDSVLGIIGSGPYKAKYLSDGNFEFLTPGRNSQGWEGFALFQNDEPAKTLHLSATNLRGCAPSNKNQAETVTEALAVCRTTDAFPKLTLHRPLDDMAYPRRCLKLQNNLRQELSRLCFNQENPSLTISLIPDTEYYLYDMLTGQTWGAKPPLKFHSGESQEIHLPTAKPLKEGQ